MKSLYNYIEESILSGRDKIKSHTSEDILELSKKWLESKNIVYDIDENNDISISRTTLKLTEQIPEYVQLKYVRSIQFNNTDSLNSSIPKEVSGLYINNAVIEDFKQFENTKIRGLFISNCDIKSLKGVPKDCDVICIGNNRQHFSIKDIKKITNTRPQDIYILGEKDSYHGNITLGKNDVEYIKNECKKIENILLKEIPELKSIKPSVREGGYHIWLRLDFLTDKEIPHGISDNSIYLDFKYTLSDSSLEKSQEGHINLTQADKQGKYKYYALKGFSAPYIDNGGKKFRKTKLNDFNAKEVTDKIIDWTKAVVKAAIEDQCGELKRY